MVESMCDEKVYQKTYFKQAEHLRNFLYYKSGNMAIAEDLVQETFIKLWQNCAKVTVQKAKSYLFTIANNLFLNAVKRDKVVLKFNNQVSRKEVKQDPQFLLEEKEFEQRLTNAISMLPEQQRIVFLMNRVDKKKYREIAETLGISIKAVEKRMHLALVSLRKIHKNV